MKLINTVSILVTACFGMSLLASGCSFAPDYVRPEMDMPVEWNNAEYKHLPSAERVAVDWWQRFNDPALNVLIEEAFAHNRDLVMAVANVDFARAQLGIARSEQLPLISANAQATPAYIDGQRSYASTAYAGMLNASWELDFWGKYRNASTAALAELMASEEGLNSLRLSLAGETANAYFQLRNYDLQLRIAQRTLETREEALVIYNARYEQGLISELDLTQSQTVVETAKTIIYQTRAARDSAEAALSALVGRSPRAIMNEAVTRGSSLEVIPTAPVIPAGLPVDLLIRRPDIRQAEQQLVAANANIGVARAAWFPSFSLTGALGLISPQLADFFTSKRQNYASYGVTASVPLLDFGRVKANVEGAEALQRSAVANYEKTVLNAYSDVRSALATQREASNVVESLTRQVQQLRLALQLASSRYDNGYSSYLDVLDAERSLFQSELDLATARSNRLSSIVNVCMSLGGGWVPPTETAEATQTNTVTNETTDAQ